MGNILLISTGILDASILNQALFAFQKAGLSYLSDCANVVGKNRIIQYLKTHPEVAVVVVSQYQDQTAFTPEEFDLISTIGGRKDRIVIPILEDSERGSSYVAKLCSLGIYTALFSCDGTFEQVASIAGNGRGKSEAREYYGISVKHVVDETGLTKAASMDVEGLESKSKFTLFKKKDASIRSHKEEINLRLDCAVLGTNVGVGSTFQSVLMASSVARCRKDLKVAVIELDGEERNFATLGMQVLNRANLEGIHSFTLGDVEYFFGLTLSAFMKTHRDAYDIVFYDFGWCTDEVIEAAAIPMDRVYAVSDAAEWRRGELAEFYRDMKLLAPDKPFWYLFSCLDHQVVSESAKILEDDQVLVIPYEASPFAPSRRTARMLADMVLFEKGRNVGKRSLPIKSRISRKARNRAVGSRMLRTVVSLLFGIMCVLLSVSWLWYQSLYKKAEETLMEAKETIRNLKEEVNVHEAFMEQYKKDVLILRTDISAGEPVTADVVEVCQVISTMDANSYVQTEDLVNTVASFDMKEGIVLTDGMIKSKPEALSPVVVTIGGDDTLHE